MATNPSPPIPVIFTSFIAAILIFSAVDASGNHHHHLGGWSLRRPSCEGSSSTDECLAENEFDMDSEISRRILATNQYIGYGALKRNTVPCSQRGASYYNCKPGASKNPYSRGCTAITRCRG